MNRRTLLSVYLLLGPLKERFVSRLYRHPNVLLIIALIIRGLLTKCVGWEFIFGVIPAVLLLPPFMKLQAAYLEEFHNESAGREDIWPFIFSCIFALSLFALPAIGDDGTVTDLRCTDYNQSIAHYFFFPALAGIFSLVVGVLYYVIRRISFRRTRTQPYTRGGTPQ